MEGKDAGADRVQCPMHGYDSTQPRKSCFSCLVDPVLQAIRGPSSQQEVLWRLAPWEQRERETSPRLSFGSQSEGSHLAADLNVYEREKEKVSRKLCEENEMNGLLVGQRPSPNRPGICECMV